MNNKILVKPYIVIKMKQFCQSYAYRVVTRLTQDWAPRVRFPVHVALTHFFGNYIIFF